MSCFKLFFLSFRWQWPEYTLTFQVTSLQIIKMCNGTKKKETNNKVRHDLLISMKTKLLRFNSVTNETISAKNLCQCRTGGSRKSRKATLWNLAWKLQRSTMGMLIIFRWDWRLSRMVCYSIQKGKRRTQVHTVAYIGGAIGPCPSPTLVWECFQRLGQRSKLF